MEEIVKIINEEIKNQKERLKRLDELLLTVKSNIGLQLIQPNDSISVNPDSITIFRYIKDEVLFFECVEKLREIEKGRLFVDNLNEITYTYLKMLNDKHFIKYYICLNGKCDFEYKEEIKQVPVIVGYCAEKLKELQ
jgi:hypothetical protein